MGQVIAYGDSPFGIVILTILLIDAFAPGTSFLSHEIED
jgi:hypothetical protein